MNARSSTRSLAALSLGLAGLAGEAPPPADMSTSGFDSVGIDYKKPQVLSESFFNPFHVQASAEAMQKRGGAAVTDEAVTEAVATRGISGLLCGAKAGACRVILGDQVFAVGEELTFPDNLAGDPIPLVKGASVVLRRVSRDSLGLDVSPETESTRRVNIPLKAFWRP